jgi:hypothetical protein
MKKLVLFSLLLASVQSLFSQQIITPGSYVPGEVLVQIDDPMWLPEIISDLQIVSSTYTGLRVSKEISRPVNIWLFAFDENTISHDAMLAALYTNKHILIAQNNHYVQERATTPNDAIFGTQWHHVDGSDNDIDSDLAWDITTGGATNNGHEIVVCVIEGGGSDWNHEDLIANHWVNTAEIDGNGIDDDGNGYIDDYNGWNSGNNTDNIAAGDHGTGVSGMIGARGNNNIDAAGINWNVKIMQVDMAGITESNVIAAYTYPLTMRQLYTSSGGTEGAFVVATNASWGIDNANPSGYPLWCNFYNTLGQAGILNCGATANNNVNIDAVGDMPTACSSPYMISVTATNSSDVRTFSGYGQTTIDVGAPGGGVITLANTNATTTTSGTSFASPLTAGVIALIYSVPCSDIAILAMSDPQAAADLVREALLDGVDLVPNLTTETVTGGRINAFNSVELISVLSPFTFLGATTVINESAGNDGSIDLTVTGGNGTLDFSWTGPGGFTSSNEDPSGLIAGSYEVTVTDANNCSFTLSNILVTVTSTASIQSNSFEFSIYPNPAQKEFTLHLTEGQQVTLVLYDAIGNTVLTQQANKTSSIGVSALAKGIYVYTITTQSGNQATGKLVIE